MKERGDLGRQYGSSQYRDQPRATGVRRGQNSHNVGHFRYRVFNGEFTTGEIYRFLSYSAVSTRGCLLGVELADRFLSTVLRQAACTPVIKVVSESIWGRRNVKGKIDRRRHNRSLG